MGNAVVDKYGDYKVSQWTYEKIPLDIRSTNSISSRSGTDADADSDEGRIEFVTKSVNELRQTVSKRTGLVDNTNDRKSWNAWLTSASASSSSLEEEVMTPGNYTFMYRSYANYEEAGCIKKSLFHWKTWYGIVANSRGYMTVHPDGKQVSITDIFRKRFFTIIVCRWNGMIVKKGIEKDTMGHNKRRG